MLILCAKIGAVNFEQKILLWSNMSDIKNVPRILNVKKCLTRTLVGVGVWVDRVLKREAMVPYLVHDLEEGRDRPLG